MRTALITGIGGSIGCHVYAHFMHNTDWKIVGIDSFRHKGLTDRVTHMWEEHPEWRERTEIITHDLSVPISDVMRERIGPVDYIVNLASLPDVFDSLQTPVPFVKMNVDIILTMLEYARALPDLKAFLQISTDEVYGPTDGSFLHREWDPIVPSSPYSASKAAQEAIAISYWRAYKVPLIIVNLMNNFGEMQGASKFPAIVQRKVQAGEVVTVHGTETTQGSRHYIHSRNSADAFGFLLVNTEPYLHVDGVMDRPDRYNIPGDLQITNMDLTTFIAGCLDKPVATVYEDFAATRPGHDRHYGLDGGKLRELGWKPPRTFAESMRATVQWQKEHPEWLALK